MKPLPLLLSALLLAAALPATAQQMNYQGRLTDASGNALTDGRYTVEFSLWNAATGGSQIWGPYVLDGAAGNGHAPQIELVNGRFNTVLGSVDTTNRPIVNAFAATRYLQIKVGTNAPIIPRQVILDAPSALSARTAEFAQNALAAQTAEFANRIPNVYADTNRVGIGTDAPKQTLHINGDTYAKGHIWLHAFEGDGQSGTAYLQARDDSNASEISLELRTKYRTALVPAVKFWPLGTSNFFRKATFEQGAEFSNETNFNGLNIFNGSAKFMGGAEYRQRVRVYPADGTSDPWVFSTHVSNTGTSNFSIGTAGIELTYGNAWKPGGGSWANYSDARLKKDVRDLTGALDKLGQLRAVTFDYKEPGRFGVAGRQTGFIAQEVEKVFPGWITESQLPGGGDKPGSGEKYKSISISGFESLTVQALRELREEKDTQIKTLTDKNTALHDTIKAQEARLAKLEQAVTAFSTKDDKPAKSSTAQR